MASWGPDRSHGAGLGATECPNFFDLARTSLTSSLTRLETSGHRQHGQQRGRRGALKASSRSRTSSESSFLSFDGLRDCLYSEPEGRMGVMEKVLNVTDKTGHVKRSMMSSPDFFGSRRARKLQDWGVNETMRAANAMDRFTTPPASRGQTPTSSRPPTGGGGATQMMKYSAHPPTRSDPCRYASSIYRPLDFQNPGGGNNAPQSSGEVAQSKSSYAPSLSRYTAHPATRSDACRFAGNLYRPLPGALTGQDNDNEA